jgi:hypothetical protein
LAAPSTVKEIQFPRAAAHVLQYFWELNAARQIGGMGSPQAISYSELWAWGSMRRIRLADWEVRLLRTLDSEWFGARNTNGKRRPALPKPPAPPTQKRARK